MGTEPLADATDPGLGGLFQELARAASGDRAGVLLKWLETHPEVPLDLSSGRDGPAPLDEIDLSRRALRGRTQAPGGPPAWWDASRQGLAVRSANLQGARLRKAKLGYADLGGADLRDAVLTGADLRGASLEEAVLAGADLAGACLIRAALGRSDLREALLEEADLRGAALRFGDLRGGALEEADLRGADLWSANLEKAELVGADLRRVNLQEAHLGKANLTRANLRRANLTKADLREADLSGADLRDATLTGADLHSASLCSARLEGLDLTHTELFGTRLAGVYLERTRLRRDQFGEAIGEEEAGDFEAAGRGYLALERNFLGLGDPDAASWAYRRRRRMQKLAAGRQTKNALAQRHWRSALLHAFRYLTDQATEWLCDYGESIPRVLATMLFVYVAFAVLYGVTGSVMHVRETPTGTAKWITRDPVDLAIFSLLAMTTSGSPVVGLVPRTEAVHLLTGLQASLGIGLTGLLGFVLGNRVRR